MASPIEVTDPEVGALSRQWDAENLTAGTVAHAAGQILLQLRRLLDEGNIDSDALRAVADRASHEFIVGQIRARFPGDPILSEEGSESDDLIQVRLASSRTWIVDPLDGTREFGEVGRVDWAVHVAFCNEGQAVAGAVSLPAMRVTETASRPLLAPRAAGPLRMVFSRTRRPKVATEVASRLGAEAVEMGSAGAKIMAVLHGSADIYIHSGGQYEWDSAAPVSVATAAGLHVSRTDGSQLSYNRPHPWLPDLLVCRPELAETVLKTIEQVERSMSVEC